LIVAQAPQHIIFRRERIMENSNYRRITYQIHENAAVITLCNPENQNRIGRVEVEEGASQICCDVGMISG
jgi:hypothetical protein